jgi:hypothetical protein
VLKKLVEAVDMARKKANEKTAKQATEHPPVRAGTRPLRSNKPPAAPGEGMLDHAKDWKIAADLPGMREYPELIKESGLRPDMVLISDSSRTVVIIELTVPYESNMSGSHELKKAKYEGLTSEIQRRGYRTWLFAVEVGARGLAGATVYNLLQRLGLSGQARSRYLKQVAETAEKASCWIWTKRNEKNWSVNI